MNTALNRTGILNSTLFYLLLFGIIAKFSLQQSLNYHKTYRETIWRGENYADAGGYYAHLIMWFDLGYKSKNYPPNYQYERGSGVTTDQTSIVKTKYTCGVAYLQTPFYLANRLLGNLLNYETDANSLSNKKMIDIAASFYLWAGAVFLFLFISRFTKKLYAFISVAFIVCGTNVIYYSAYHTGMSHIYSFFLSALYLYAGWNFLQSKKNTWFVLLAIAGSIIVLIRPTNILFLPLLFFIPGGNKDVLSIFKPKWIGIALLCLAVVWLPQSIYWYQLHGSIIYYSYTGEGFTNWAHPKLAQVLFSPINGLVLYNPITLVILGITVISALQKNWFSVYYLFLLLVMIYLTASWHAPTFGCGYGQRNFVELFGAAALPLAISLQQLELKRKFILFSLLLILGLSTTAFNLKLVSKYNHCSMATGYWNFDNFWYNLSFKKVVIKDDFNHYFDKTRTITSNNITYLRIPSTDEITHLLSISYYKVPPNVRKGFFSMKVRTAKAQPGFNMELWVTHQDSIYFSTTMVYIDKKMTPGKWNRVTGIFYIHIPPETPRECGLFIYVYNKDREEIEIDQARIEIE